MASPASYLLNGYRHHSGFLKQNITILRIHLSSARCYQEATWQDGLHTRCSSLQGELLSDQLLTQLPQPIGGDRVFCMRDRIGDLAIREV